MSRWNKRSFTIRSDRGIQILVGVLLMSLSACAPGTRICFPLKPQLFQEVKSSESTALEPEPLAKEPLTPYLFHFAERKKVEELPQGVRVVKLPEQPKLPDEIIDRVPLPDPTEELQKDEAPPSTDGDSAAEETATPTTEDTLSEETAAPAADGTASEETTANSTPDNSTAKMAEDTVETPVVNGDSATNPTTENSTANTATGDSTQNTATPATIPTAVNSVANISNIENTLAHSNMANGANGNLTANTAMGVSGSTIANSAMKDSLEQIATEASFQTTESVVIPLVTSISRTASAESEIRPFTSTLVVENLSLVREVKGYGRTTPFARPSFSPSQTVIVYAQIDQFVTLTSSDGFYTAMRGEITIRNAMGEIVFRQTPNVAEETCDVQRRDYYLAYILRIPPNLPPGLYQLEFRVEDCCSGRQGIATRSIVLN